MHYKAMDRSLYMHRFWQLRGKFHVVPRFCRSFVASRCDSSLTEIPYPATKKNVSIAMFFLAAIEHDREQYDQGMQAIGVRIHPRSKNYTNPYYFNNHVKHVIVRPMLLH